MLLGAAAVACAGACNLLGKLPVQGLPDLEGGPGLDDGSSETGADTGAEPEADGRAEEAGDAGGSDSAMQPAPGNADADAGPATTIIAFAGTPPVSLAVDGTHVYWTESNGGVFKVARDAEGGPVTTLKQPDDSGTSAGRIATDGTNVYWADAAHQAIQYVSVLGGTPAPLVGSHNPAGIATDGTHVYWSDLDDSRVYRVAILDAGTTENMTTGNLSAVNVYAIAVTSSWLFWAELEGTGLTLKHSGYTWGVPLTEDAGLANHFTWDGEWNRNLRFIAADDLAIYWTMAGDTPGGTGVVGRNPLPPPQEFIEVAPAIAPGAIAVSATHDFFWVDQGWSDGGAIRWVRYDADAAPAPNWTLPGTVAYGATAIALGALAVDRDAVYWANGAKPYAIEKVRLADLRR
jgi:hypothetical protein